MWRIGEQGGSSRLHLGEFRILIIGGGGWKRRHQHLLKASWYRALRVLLIHSILLVTL